jgi:hypothetical protein
LKAATSSFGPDLVSNENGTHRVSADPASAQHNPWNSPARGSELTPSSNLAPRHPGRATTLTTPVGDGPILKGQNLQHRIVLDFQKDKRAEADWRMKKPYAGTFFHDVENEW